MLETITQADPFQQIPGARCNGRARPPGKDGGDGDVVDAVEIRNQIEGLKDEADAGSSQGRAPRGTEVIKVGILETDASLRQMLHPYDGKIEHVRRRK